MDNSIEIMPPLSNLSHLKEFGEEACQLNNEIEELKRPPPLERIKVILHGLICCQKAKLPINSRLASALNLMIKRLTDHME